MRRPSVTIVLSSAPHQSSLPGALVREGLLRAAVRTAPDLEILEPGPAGELTVTHKFPSDRAGNRILWAIWRRVPLRWRKFIPLLGWAGVADRRISRRLPASDVFHGIVGVSIASLLRAKARGAITLIDCPTQHQIAFQREVRADCASAGVSPEGGEHVMPPFVIRRCEQQYELCDKIIVYSAAAQRSFQPFPYGDKAVVVHPGVDHESFHPAVETRRSDTFRVCYVGRIEAAKGLHHLIDAWKQLALPNAELTLAGRVLQEYSPSDSIRFAGILRAEEIARCLRESDLFVFPSVNEGLSLALLEAMASGLPVIACQDTGAEDCLTSGREGLLVPGRNTEALAGAILWCYQHRDELAAMGKASRMRIEAEFTLSHYHQRLIRLYESAIVGI